jgi:hypothetical protein
MNTKHASQVPIDIRRSHQRFHTKISWLDSHHRFNC